MNSDSRTTGGVRRFDVDLLVRVRCWVEVSPAMLQTSWAVAPPVETGDANRLYYSQTRSQQEAGLLDFMDRRKRREYGEKNR